MKAVIRFFDMFSGIGGFRAGLERVGGYSCIGHCEIDPYANKSYRAIFDTESEVYFNDATKINPTDIPDFDLLCAGFSCQSFSIAGKRGGFKDSRGTMFFEIAGVLQKKQPKYFLLENVPGLLSHDKGQTFLAVLCALDEWGMVSNGKCLTAQISLSPNPERECFLSDTVMKDAPEKYYLSPSATNKLLSKSLEEVKGKESTT